MNKPTHFLKRKALFSTSATALMLAFASAAQAQQGSDPAGNSAATAKAEQEGEQVGEIIVTAQRREENMQSVPISIQAFSGTTLANANVRGIDDLSVITPGLSITRNAGGVTPFIRGIGTAAGAAGTEAAVATYVDGVYHQSNYTNHLSFSDIERVEVLKGPQGTLFGRNTTGGLLNIVTKSPSHEFGGNLSISAGNYEIFEGKAYVTGGITENIAASLSGYMFEQGRGFVKNVLLGTDVFYHKEISGRGKIQYSANDTKVTLAADYADLEDPRGFTRGVPQGSIGGSLTQPPSTWTSYIGFREIEANNDAKVKARDFGASVTIEHAFDGFDAISISGWRNSRTEIGTVTEPFDNDYTRSVLASAHIVFIDRNFTQEVRLSSNNDSNLSWLVGGFYLDGASIADLEVPTALRGRLESKSYSGFAEVGYKLFDGAGKLTVGGRYTIDKRRISGSVAGFPRPTAAVSPTAEFKQPTYRIVYDHHITDDILTYVSFNHGFKSGNYNLIPVGTPAYRPETINAYEAGFKTTLFDRHLRFNGAFFRYDYKDLQLNTVTATSTTTVNAAGAKVEGAEIELNAVLPGGIGLDFGASYANARYTEFTNAQTFIVNRDLAGNLIAGTRSASAIATGKQLVKAPKFTASAGLSYVATMENGKITANVRGQYTGAFPWEPSGRLRQNGYVVVNAGIGYEADEGWGVRFEGTNLTDAKYSTFTASSAPTGDFYTPSDPTLYQIVASLKF